MRRLAIGVLSVVLWGCSAGNTRIGVLTRRPPAGWKGAYVLSPDKIASLEGKAYSQIHFLGAGRAQVSAFDSEHAEWGWAASLSTAADSGEGFRARCESITVFHVALNSHTLYRRPRLGAEKWLAGDKSSKQAAEKVLEGERLSKVVPKAFWECHSDEFVKFRPEVLEGGQVVLVSEDGALRFYPTDSEDFRAVVRALPVAAGKLKPLTLPREAKMDGRGIYQSPSNQTLPYLPQTQRFYRLLHWQEVGSDLKGEAAPRPVARGESSDTLYELIERGEWVLPKPVEVRRVVSESGAERVETLSLETLAVSDLRNSRLEIVYEVEGEPATVLVQTVSARNGAKLLEESVELRQK
jgi:hypothetical protein